MNEQAKKILVMGDISSISLTRVQLRNPNGYSCEVNPTAQIRPCTHRAMAKIRPLYLNRNLLIKEGWWEEGRGEMCRLDSLKLSMQSLQSQATQV